MKQLSIRQEGTRVLVLSGGVLLFDMPWEAARELANALRAKAGAAEQVEKYEVVAKDDAILMRAGAPFGVAMSPEVREEARKLAMNDRDLRRFMPQIKTREKFGTPTVRNHDAKR